MFDDNVHGSDEQSSGKKVHADLLFFFMPLLYGLLLIFGEIKSRMYGTTRGEKRNGKRISSGNTTDHIFSINPQTVSLITVTFCQKFPRKRERMEINEIEEKTRFFRD